MEIPGLEVDTNLREGHKAFLENLIQEESQSRASHIVGLEEGNIDDMADGVIGEDPVAGNPVGLEAAVSAGLVPLEDLAPEVAGWMAESVVDPFAAAVLGPESNWVS